MAFDRFHAFGGEAVPLPLAARLVRHRHFDIAGRQERSDVSLERSEIVPQADCAEQVSSRQAPCDQRFQDGDR
jgi:hypothetical protein